MGDGEAKERIQFRFAPRLVGLRSIGWVLVGEGGTGVPLMLGSPKLPKRGSDPRGPKWGVPEFAPHFFGFGVTCPWAKNGGAKSTSPMWAP